MPCPDQTGRTLICWDEAGRPQSAVWRSESRPLPPKRVVIADDRITADVAYRLACEGTALLWRGDFQNARQLLDAMARRIDRPSRKSAQAPVVAASPAEAFNLHRQAQSQRARTLAMLLLPLDTGFHIPLRRAPDVTAACSAAYGSGEQAGVIAMRELLGLIGAHEWRKKGIEIAALGERIHPHYGVFSPVRGEYIDLVAQMPFNSHPLSPGLAFDIGTGTGVLAAVLAHRGVKQIIATDLDPRALTCARANLARLGLDRQVEVVEADLFPAGRAALIICNPPWLPARPAVAIEHAIFDPASRMLRGFINGLADHLEPGGEGWLVLSDLAEHLGLRTRAELSDMIKAAGLMVLGRSDVRPNHSRASDQADPLHFARAAELTSLWRLAVHQAT